MELRREDEADFFLMLRERRAAMRGGGLKGELFSVSEDIMRSSSSSSAGLLEALSKDGGSDVCRIVQAVCRRLIFLKGRKTAYRSPSDSKPQCWGVSCRPAACSSRAYEPRRG
jgi:hypothetical protein